MWRSGEVCSPWICGGGVALRPLCGFVSFGLGVQISVLGSSELVLSFGDPAACSKLWAWVGSLLARSC